jgi:hypothetical protein
LNLFSLGVRGVVAVCLAGCGARTPPARPLPPPVPLHLEPACDLAPAAGGLSWIVDAKPRAVAEIPDLIPAISRVLPEERLRLFTASHGGIDLRQVKELCIARYRDTVLAIVDVPLDGEKVAAAFDHRTPKGAIRTLVTPNPRVVKLSAEIDNEAQQLIVFGQEGAALEQGKAGPLRAAEAFAFGKLKKASPALRGAALKRAAEVLGEQAPVRVFAPGPFEGEVAQGLGGLLRAATAVGASAKWAGGSNIAVRIVLTGAWGEDAPAASERLAAAAQLLSESPAGHLFGLHRPAIAPFVHVERDALVLDVTLDGDALARGMHDAVDAEVGEIMRR